VVFPDFDVVAVQRVDPLAVQSAQLSMTTAGAHITFKNEFPTYT